MSAPTSTAVTVRRAAADDARAVHAVVRAAFGPRPDLDPPAAALAETPESLAVALGRDGGLLAEYDGAVVGALVFDVVDEVLFLRRFGVVPSAQHAGVAHALVAAAAEVATEAGLRGLGVLAREELPATIGFWRAAGFSDTDRQPPYRELLRWLPTSYDVPDADAMRDLGARLAADLRAGDLLVLTGELGAGKTTFTQGLGAGLGVRSGITSPTFVIAQVHPSVSGGPALVHADAYRLGSAAEIDDLDLDTDLETAVTVVEWGEGLAEGLAESRLEVRIARALADEAGDPEQVEDHDPRVVTVQPVGARWRAHRS